MDSEKNAAPDGPEPHQPAAENAQPTDAVAASVSPEGPTPPTEPDAHGAAKAREPVTAVVPFRRHAEAPKVEPPPRDETATAARAPSRAARFGLLAASIALAAGIGAAAGAAGFAGVNRLVQAPAPPPSAETPQRVATAAEAKALKDSIAQLRGSVRALSDSVGSLRGQMESAGKGTQAQFAKVNEGIERLERAQAEPAARVAKLAEAVERLERRAAPAAAAAAPASAPETTGAIKPPPPLPPLGGDQRALKQILDGWAVRDVDRGVALVEGRIGSFEVIVGDDIRGAGRVQEIRRQDGRWIVVTSRGVIVAR